MKKILSTVFVLTALLAMSTGTAFAGAVVELIGVSNNGTGPTFTFRVTGKFSQGELKNGFVSVEGGEDFPLYCAQQDEDTVVCHTSKKVGANAVVVGFGGARFWAAVPEQTICYPVYDWNYSSSSSPASYWVLQGSNCQGNEAQYGDFIYDFYAPSWNDTYDYEYLPGDFCGWENPGEGYYYPFCPSFSA